MSSFRRAPFPSSSLSANRFQLFSDISAVGCRFAPRLYSTFREFFLFQIFFIVVRSGGLVHPLFPFRRKVLDFRTIQPILVRNVR